MKIHTSLQTVALVAGLLSVNAMSADEVDFTVDAYGDYGTTYMAAYLEDFTEKHNLQYSFVNNNWGDHHNKLATNLATGSGAADIVFVDTGMIGSFVGEGGFVDLTDKMEGLNIDFAQYAISQGQGDDGRQYGVPIDLGPGVLFYRRSMLNESGLALGDITKDIDAYIDYGRKLKEQNVWLVGNATDVATALIRFNVEEGNGTYTNQKGEPIITSERFVNAFSVAKTIRDEGLDGNLTAWTDDWYEGFREGKFATSMTGAWMLGHLQNWIAPKTSGDWGASNLPDDIYGSWGGSFLAIPKQSKNPEQAWQLIEYMTKANQQMEGFKKIAAFPANTATYQDPAFAEPIEFLGNQKARELFSQIAGQIKPVLPSKVDHIAQALVLETALAEVLNDGRDIKEALEAAEKQLKRRMRTL